MLQLLPGALGETERMISSPLTVAPCFVLCTAASEDCGI